jgi:hypothetical protein
MNQTRPVEIVSDTQQRKSLRHRKPLEVNNSFFKKVYKPRNPQACQINSNAKQPSPDTKDPEQAMLHDAAIHLFHPVTPSSLQFKTIMNLRIKKLKRLKSRQACQSSNGPTSSPGMNKKSEFLQVRSTLRSIQARIRHRDYRGKFLSSEKNNSEMNEATTVDLREVSTTRGSLLGQPMLIETLWHKSEALSRLDSLENEAITSHLTAAGGDPCAGESEQPGGSIEEYLSYIRVQPIDFRMAEERLFADAEEDVSSEEQQYSGPLETQAFDHPEPPVSRKLDFSNEDHMEPFILTDCYLAEQFLGDPFGYSSHSLSRPAFV